MVQHQNKITLNLKNPNRAITRAVNKKINKNIPFFVHWIRTQLVTALIEGGFGIKGIKDTPFYRFVTSPDGISQLGIRPEDPPKLLKAYRDSARVVLSRKSITLLFGDTRLLKMGTPHFASGKGRLRVNSWMEWVIDRKGENAGYVERSKVPPHLQENIRLEKPLGGLMLPKGAFGSTGSWSFPGFFTAYSAKWFRENDAAIRKILLSKAIKMLFR